MKMRSCLAAFAVVLLTFSSTRADFVISGPTVAPTGNFASPRSNLADDTADQIFSTSVNLDMWFFQLRVSETANEPAMGLNIEFYIDDNNSNTIEPGTDTLIGSFVDLSFNDTSPATTLYEWKLDTTDANFNNQLLGVVIDSGLAVAGSTEGQQNGVERIAFSATTAVPEPSAFLYGGVVAAIAGITYRRRQKASA